MSAVNGPNGVVLLILALLKGGVASAAEAIAVPVVTDPALQMTLVASEPTIVTPIGAAVDARGRLYVVESHTHFRPPDYLGPATDQIKWFEDRDGDGRYETVGIFAEGFRYAMNLAFSPAGHLCLVERGRVLELHDDNGDGRVDRQIELVRLETKSTYPHNGLSGLAFGPDGFLYLGMGENLGGPYTLRGSDGHTVSGGGEGGNIFRCHANGSGCQGFATGFWNPFGLAFYVGGHLLAVDDDPEVRPPDRLLDVIPGADFGFRYRYGAAAEHPFVAWKGELPGTLPMVDQVGEGVTSLLPASQTTFPGTYGDKVLVASWSDRRIEAHTLRAEGASLQGSSSVLVQGGDSFRPVAMAAAPDGSVYITDWVKRRYEVHGHGRIWRLSTKVPSGRRPSPAPLTEARLRLDHILALVDPGSAEAVLPSALADTDPHLRSAAVTALARPSLRQLALGWVHHPDPRVRLGVLLALRRGGEPNPGSFLSGWLTDRSEEVRMVALIWIAEDHLLAGGKREIIHRAVARRPVSSQLRQIYLAAAAALQVPPRPDLVPPDNAACLALLQHPTMHAEQISAQRDAIWTLAQLPAIAVAVAAQLQRVALDGRYHFAVRADAVGALARQADGLPGLLPLLNDAVAPVRREAIRALRKDVGDPNVRAALVDRLTRTKDSEEKEELRFAVQPADNPGPPRPHTRAEWANAVEKGGDAEAGRRVFVNPLVGCARCHRVGLLGGRLGPPLTFIGNERPQRLLESLLAPSADVVWPARQIRTHDGRELVGMVTKKMPDGGIILTDVAGQAVTLSAADIVSNRELEGSLMPDGLEETMTVAAFRDLYAFLRAQNH